MQLRLIIFCLVVGLVVCGTTADSARAGPFEKAGLSKSAGKVLTDKQADKVRGGFGGGAEKQQVMAAVLASLGYADRDALRAAMQNGTINREAMRDAMTAAMADLGITRPSFNGGPPAGFNGGPPAGANRTGFRSRRGLSARRGL